MVDGGGKRRQLIVSMMAMAISVSGGSRLELANQLRSIDREEENRNATREKTETQIHSRGLNPTLSPSGFGNPVKLFIQDLMAMELSEGIRKLEVGLG
ncbi:hypothetical protein C8R46DRAFT_1085727 [Mycena filopes]|nr:hypothetical protein C8R46DRAFT_1085727 [Mycena filopes]